ncbi:MAG TPA: stage II sporulation protein D [Firmicutes bacterium]|nr:stage II sporulation protein D [Candidatus Fermentithermobacillaceae bacterium]
MKKAFFGLLFIFGLLAGLLAARHIEPAPSNLPLPAGTGYPILKIDVFYEPENTVISMDLEDYVRNVVASEMPASFHPEALKAQAVLARTYAVRKMQVFGGAPSLPGKADVTSNPAKDQAWNPEQVIKERWGIIGAWLNWPKIERAVRETQGLILTYKGMPAEAVYHSTCGGMTEAAKDVWGNDVEYLQSVACSYCVSSPHYKVAKVILSSRAISDSMGRLGISVPASRVSQTGALAVTSLSPTGRIKQISVNGKAIRGVEFRSALELKSTKFTWAVQGDNIVFQVAGYGHGVGLCQYGADGAAKAGRNFLEILAHYYPGTAAAQIFTE